MRHLLHRIPHTFAKVFVSKFFVVHILAVVLTYLLVMSGFDWFYFTSTQIPTLQKILFPAIVIGGIFPIVVPLVIALNAYLLPSRMLAVTASALGQAAVLGIVISSLYKAFTGRIQPDIFNAVIDGSRQFQFGILNHGIFWGWPSSHTTIAFAMALTACTLYRKNKTLRFLFFCYALYIGIGVSTSIHWFSDMVAGALIGSVIGVTVGTSFLHLMKKRTVSS